MNHLEEEIDGIKLIVSNLVSFSGDKQHLSEPFDVNLLLSQTLTLLRPAARDKNIVCTFSSNETELFLNASKTEIRQVMLNLIKNSFEVLVSGGILHIETMWLDGKAVPKKNNGSNMGLGLPMSYGIVKKYNGELTFHNLPDRGCEFVVTLPAGGFQD